jgi:hypothetical protein
VADDVLLFPVPPAFISHHWVLTPARVKRPKHVAAKWIERVVKPGLREELLALVASPALEVISSERPLGWPEMHDMIGGGKEATRRFERARHRTRVVATVAPCSRPLHASAALAVARALAAEVNGVVMQGNSFQLLSPKTYRLASGVHGGFSPLDHGRSLGSPEGPGLMYLRYYSLAAFGLPDLEVHNVPHAVWTQIGDLLNVVALLLVERVLAQLTSGDVEPGKTTVRIPLLLEVTTADIRRVKPDFSSSVSGSAEVRLKLDPRGGHRPPGVRAPLRLGPSLTVGPPDGEEDPGGWAYRFCETLVGPAEQAFQVTDLQEVARWAAATREELPGLKQRFTQGLGRAALKVKVPMSDADRAGAARGIEMLVWVSVERWYEDEMVGRIEALGHPLAGTETRFPAEVVLDWQVVHDDGRSEGGRSLK